MSLQPTPTVLISPKNDVLLLGIIHYFKYRNLFEVFSIEYILVVYRIQGHSNTLFQQHKRTLYIFMNIAMWSIPKSDWLYSLQPKMEKLYTVSSNKTGSWLWLRSWTLSCQVQFSSVSQSCPTLCEPMNRSTPGLPVHHQLPEFTQAYAHWVSDAIQPSHPLSSPSLPALNLFQHRGLFQWVSSSHQVAKVLELQLQHQSFQWTPRTDLL